VVAATTKSFAEKHPAELAFIKKVSISNDVMNAVLAWGKDNQAEGNEMAGYFMQKHEKMWSAWLPADVAAKTKKAMSK
jgi:glycine betaine/proline transport system substrate-binding protein